MKNPFLQKLKENAFPFLIFILVLIVFYFPLIEGKTLLQNDVVQSGGAMQEAKQFAAKTGEEILWSNSSFSGMPVWWGTSGNIIYLFAKYTSFIPSPIFIGILGFVSFYLLGMSLGGNPWISFAMSIAFVFSSFNIISLEAGHINKILDMMVMPALVAGVIWCYRQELYKGLLVMLIFSSLILYYGHYQIVYYEGIVLVVLATYYFVRSYKEKQLKQFWIASALIVVVGMIGLGVNIIKLWDNKVYSESSTRGGSELAVNNGDKGGLDKEYAMGWSNGGMEVFTTLVPYFYGGSSNEELSQSSSFYKSMIANGVTREQAKEFVKNVPLYWGDQPFTSGPVYFGATIFFLFVLGFFVVKDSIKWWILGVTIVALLLSMGKNIDWLSDLCFNYLPLYNKFRAVTMVMSIAQLTFPWLAVYTLYSLYEKKISYEQFWNGLKWTLISCGGILIIFTLFGELIFSFSNENDVKQFKDYPVWFLDSLIEERASKFRSDSLRSLFFVLAIAALLWAFVKEKIKQPVFFVVLTLLVFIDIVGVDFRYLNYHTYKSKKAEKSAFMASSVDEKIMADTTYFRVFNLAKNPFNDATTSYYHKSIGGYSAIKLSRYQDVIEKQLRENINSMYSTASGRQDTSGTGKMNVYNMLNMKYAILPQDNADPFLWLNTGALGNAWMVSKYKVVSDASSEMSALNTIDPKREVVLDKKFENEVKNTPFGEDSLASIKLTVYHPNRLTYVSSSSVKSIAVFSEIYYQPGWNAYIDGKLVTHFRVNYILRAMVLPKGNHKIEFKFEPQHHFIGVKIATVFSGILLLSIVGCVVGIVLQKNKEIKS